MVLHLLQVQQLGARLVPGRYRALKVLAQVLHLLTLRLLQLLNLQSRQFFPLSNFCVPRDREVFELLFVSLFDGVLLPLLAGKHVLQNCIFALPFEQVNLVQRLFSVHVLLILRLTLSVLVQLVTIVISWLLL